jgi:26S proteasome regulatory subunit N6
MAAGYEQMEIVEKLLFKNKINEAIDELNKIVSAPVQSGEESLKTREVAIMKLGSTLAKHSMADELGDLISNTRVSISGFSKAKAAKLIRALVDQFLDMKSDIKYTKGVCLSMY